MSNQTLKIGTKLQNEYGTWIVTDITHYHGCVWYDISNERGSIVLYPSEIRFYTIIG